jgi:hypothetical protein
MLEGQGSFRNAELRQFQEIDLAAENVERHAAVAMKAEALMREACPWRIDRSRRNWSLV